MADQEVSLELKVIKSGLENIESLIKELGGAGVETGKFEAKATELGSALDKLAEQQRLVDAFVKLKQETVGAESAMQAAKTKAAELAKELAATETPTKAQVAAFEKARKSARGAEEAYTTNSSSLQQLRGKLKEAGISTTDLAGTQVRLKKTQEELTNQGAELVQSLGDTKSAQDTLAQSAEKTGYSVEQAMAKVGIRRHAEIEAEIGEVRKAYKALADSGELTERELAQANLKTQESIRSLKAETNGWVQSLGKMKFELAAAGAAVYGIGRFFIGAAKESATFGGKMAEISTLLDDTSSVDGMKDAVRQLSLEYGGDVNANAQALYDIISAGASDSAEAIDTLTVANQLAIGGAADVAVSADGLTSALNAYGDAAGSATDVSDAFFTAVKAGKTTVGELSANIGKVAPLANTAGISLDELLASVASLTASGVSTSESMAQMKGAITSIIKPSKEARDLAVDLGIEFNAASLQTKGWAGFLDEVKTATGGNLETMGKLFGSVEGLNAVLTLTGEGSKKFAETMEEMGKKTGATAEAVAKMMDTPEVRGARFNAAMVDIRNSIGDAVTSFSPLLDGLTDLINQFNNLDGSTKTVIAGLSAIAVASPPLIIALSSVAKAFGILRAAVVIPEIPALIGGLNAAGQATILTTAATTALHTALRATGWGAVAIAVGVAANELWEWHKASEQAEAAEARLAKTLSEQEKLYARLSDETGTAITSMHEFTQAKRDGIVVFDESIKKWTSAAIVQAKLAEETAKAAQAQERQTEQAKKLADPLRAQAKEIALLSTTTERWSEKIAAVDHTAEGAAEAITSMVANADLASAVDMGGLIAALDNVKEKNTELGASIEKELIERIKKLDSQQLNTLMLSLKRAFEQGTISAEQYAARAKEVTGAAARQMGIDIEQALGKTTSATRNALANINTLSEGMKAAGATTKEQSAVMSAALEKAFAGAKTKEDVAAINATLQELAKQGLITAEHMLILQQTSTSAMEGMAGSSSENTNRMIEDLRRLRREQSGLGTDTEETTEKVEQQEKATGGVAAAIANHMKRLRDEFAEMGDAAAAAFDEMVEKSVIAGESVHMFVERFNASVEKLRERLADAQQMQTKLADRSINDLRNLDSASERTLAATLRNAEGMEYLDQTRLDAIRSEVDRLRQANEQLEQSLQSTINSLRDELDQMDNNRGAIEQRDYARRKEELEQALEDARAGGNAQAEKDARESLSLLEKVHKRKMQQIEEERRERQLEEAERRNRDTDRSEPAPRDEPQSVTTTTVRTQEPSYSRMVRIELTCCGKSATVYAESETDLLTTLETVRSAS